MSYELRINVVKLRGYSLGVSLFARLLTQDAIAARLASDSSPGLWPKESIPAKNISYDHPEFSNNAYAESPLIALGLETILF